MKRYKLTLPWVTKFRALVSLHGNERLDLVFQEFYEYCQTQETELNKRWDEKKKVWK